LTVPVHAAPAPQPPRSQPNEPQQPVETPREVHCVPALPGSAVVVVAAPVVVVPAAVVVVPAAAVVVVPAAAVVVVPVHVGAAGKVVPNSQVQLVITSKFAPACACASAQDIVLVHC
jgi:hypothetical protein